jgi:hypothetical protein
VSVTAVIGPKQPPLPPKQQPPIVSMFPVVAASAASKKLQPPVLHIPEYTPTLSFGGSVHKRTLKKQIPVTSAPTSGGGHPGMPNGLLQLSTSLQQARPKVTPKVTAKDHSARMALTKMGLLDSAASAMASRPITMSMARSAASAVSLISSKKPSSKPSSPSKPRPKSANGETN